MSRDVGREVLESAALAAGSTTAGDEHAEHDALEPSAQVGVGLVLAFELERALERVLKHVLCDGAVSRKAKGPRVEVGTVARQARAKLARVGSSGTKLGRREGRKGLHGTSCVSPFRKRSATLESEVNT
jgi:hypothetical protein